MHLKKETRNHDPSLIHVLVCSSFFYLMLGGIFLGASFFPEIDTGKSIISVH